MIVTFLLFLLLFVILPSIFLFKLVKIQLPEDKLIRTGLLLIIGIVQLTLVTFLIRFFGFEFWILWILPVVSIFFLFFQVLRKWQIPTRVRITNKGILLVLLLAVISQTIILFPGGMKGKDRYFFPFMHDTMWGIALSVELSDRFPPQNPAMVGLPLKNNHYFYPLFVATAHRITHINFIDLYFHFMPILVSLLFGLSLYAVSTLFTKSHFFQGLTIFMGFFCGSISYLLVLWYGWNFNWEGNTFLVDQPLSQIVNPYSVLAFSFLLFSTYILSMVIDAQKKIQWRWVLLLVLLTGSSYGFKSFAAVTMVSALTFSILSFGIGMRKWKLLWIIPMIWMLFLPIFFYITEPQKATLNFYPGWVLTEMMTKNDGLHLVKFGEIESYYKSIGNTLGLLKLKGIEFTIYLVGNLGVRITGVAVLALLLVNRKVKTGLSKLTIWYIAWSIFVSFSIPLLFNLNITSYNIVQFTPYALVLLGVLTTFSLEKFYYFPRRINRSILGPAIIFVSILLAIPTNMKYLYEKLVSTVDSVGMNEMEAINFLKENTPKNAVILIDPRQYTDPQRSGHDPIYIPALSERHVYIASPGYVRQTGKDPQFQLNTLYRYFDERTGAFEDRRALGDKPLIFLHKPYNHYFLEKAAREGFMTLFENDSVIILQDVNEND
ncbi:hypothetical protein HYW55_05730 [Candidatus Gottesmanbacteria bacterium]|nr:hypothetical protein [Candidatus Gottesmanbacteria bacterium]